MNVKELAIHAIAIQIIESVRARCVDEDEVCRQDEYKMANAILILTDSAIE